MSWDVSMTVDLGVGTLALFLSLSICTILLSYWKLSAFIDDIRKGKSLWKEKDPGADPFIEFFSGLIFLVLSFGALLLVISNLYEALAG